MDACQPLLNALPASCDLPDLTLSAQPPYTPIEHCSSGCCALVLQGSAALPTHWPMMRRLARPCELWLPLIYLYCQGQLLQPAACLLMVTCSAAANSLLAKQLQLHRILLLGDRTSSSWQRCRYNETFKQVEKHAPEIKKHKLPPPSGERSRPLLEPGGPARQASSRPLCDAQINMEWYTQSLGTADILYSTLAAGAFPLT